MTDLEKEYQLYVEACAEQGHFVLNYMNWSASRKYEQEKARFQEHFRKMHEKEEKEKKDKDGQGRTETAPE